MTFDDRFWSHVNKTDSCWLWTAGKGTGGYGSVKRNGRMEYTHRTSWRIHNGEIPQGMQINHRCDVPACVNPEHLYLGTQMENMRDKVSRNRQATFVNQGGDWIRNRVRGSRVAQSKLTEKEIPFVRYWLDKGYEGQQVAEAFGVSGANISQIKIRHTWAHVDG